MKITYYLQREWKIILLFVISGFILTFLLTHTINVINQAIEEKDQRIQAALHEIITKLESSQIPSIDKKAYFLPEAVSFLSNLGIKIPCSIILYLIFSYLVWYIFVKSFSRLSNIFFKWIDKKQFD